MNRGALAGFDHAVGAYNPLPSGGSWGGNRGRTSTDEFRAFGFNDGTYNNVVFPGTAGLGAQRLIQTNVQARQASLIFPNDAGCIVNVGTGTSVCGPGAPIPYSVAYNTGGRIRQTGSASPAPSGGYGVITVMDNQPGVASGINPYYSFSAIPFYMANGAACTLGISTDFSSNPIFTINTAGTLAVTAIHSFNSLCSLDPGVTITTRTGYQFQDAVGAIAAPIGTLTTQMGIDFPTIPIAATTNTPVRIGAGGQTLLKNPGAQIDLWQGNTQLGPSFVGSVALSPLINASGTMVLGQSGFAFGLMTMFSNTMTIKNIAATAANISGVTTFSASPTLQADTQSIGIGTHIAFVSAPTLNVINAGTISSGNWNGFQSGGTVGASVTVSSLTHFSVAGVTKTGTVTTEIGLDLPALVGTTHIGIRNADTTVFTPSTVQALVAATAVLANATMVHITSVGVITLTAAPTIAAGQDGQIVTIINDNTTVGRTITFQSVSSLAGSTLSLGATTRVVGIKGSLTLQYSAALTRWVEIGFNGGTFG